MKRTQILYMPVHIHWAIKSVPLWGGGVENS